MFPHQENGRFLVSEDGTLRIKNVEYRDEGTFVCQALNSMSNSKVTTASAVLSVRGQCFFLICSINITHDFSFIVL